MPLEIVVIKLEEIHLGGILNFFAKDLLEMLLKLCLKNDFIKFLKIKFKDFSKKHLQFIFTNSLQLVLTNS